jgi:hypothetical protein
VKITARANFGAADVLLPDFADVITEAPNFLFRRKVPEYF